MGNFHAVSTILQIHRRSHERCSIKNAFLINFAIFTGKHLCWCVGVSSGATSLKKTLTQMFSDEYCKIFKNTYFEEHLRTAASRYISKKKKKLRLKTKKHEYVMSQTERTGAKNKKLGLKKRNTLDLSVFSRNTIKNKPEKLQMRTLFSQCKN